MAKFIMDNGIDNYIRSLDSLMEGSEKGLKYAVYFGADVIANAVREEINSIPVGRKSEGDQINANQRRGLLDGLGISKMRNDDGVVNVRLGFEGYNSIRTEKYPTGQPNAMIARSIVAGTSFRNRNDFVMRAFKRSKAKAEAAMVKALNEYIERKVPK